MCHGFIQLYLRGKKGNRESNEDEREDLREQADKRTDFSQEPKRKKEKNVADGSPLSGWAPVKPTGLKLMLKRQESEKHNLLRFGLFNLYAQETGRFTFHAEILKKNEHA